MRGVSHDGLTSINRHLVLFPFWMYQPRKIYLDRWRAYRLFVHRNPYIWMEQIMQSGFAARGQNMIGFMLEWLDHDHLQMYGLIINRIWIHTLRIIIWYKHLWMFHPSGYNSSSHWASKMSWPFQQVWDFQRNSTCCFAQEIISVIHAT